MRIFVYKFLIIAVGFFLLYQFTIGYTLSKFQQSFYSINIKEKSNFIKDKLRNEIKSSLKKEKILNKDDATLIKTFLNKIVSEINNTN